MGRFIVWVLVVGLLGAPLQVEAQNWPACTAGRYCPASCAVSSQCASCQPGFYCPGTGVSIACPAGTSGPMNYASSSAYCYDCPSGHYSASSGQSSCSSCPAGQYSANNGQSSCTACASGKTSSSGSSTCAALECPAGKYGVDPSCTGCPVGRYSATAGITSSSQRSQCVAGYYTSVTGELSALHVALAF